MYELGVVYRNIQRAERGTCEDVDSFVLESVY